MKEKRLDFFTLLFRFQYLVEFFCCIRSVLMVSLELVLVVVRGDDGLEDVETDGELVGLLGADRSSEHASESLDLVSSVCGVLGEGSVELLVESGELRLGRLSESGESFLSRF